MASSRQVKIEILGDASSAKRALRETKDSADKLVPSSANAHASLGKLSDQLTNRLPVGGTAAKNALGSITAGLGTMGPAMATGVGAAAVFGAALIKMAADGVGAQLKLGSEIRSLQKITGASAEDASKLRYEFTAMGIDSATAGGAIAKLAKNINTHADALKANGVEIEHTKSGSVDLNATLASGAEAFKHAQTFTERAAIGNAMFGKSWTTMAPLLAKGKDGLHELNREAERYHLVLNQDQADKTAEFGIALRHTQEATDSLKRGIGEGLIGSLSGLLGVIEPVIHGVDEVNRALNVSGGIFMGAAEGVLNFSGGLGVAADWLNVFGQSHKKSAEEIKKMSNAELEATAATGDGTDATAELTERNKDAATVEKARTDRINEEVTALNKARDAQYASIDSTFAYEQSVIGVTDAQKAYNDAHAAAAAAGGRDPALNQAAAESQIRSGQAISASAHAAVQLAVDQATANGQTLTAVQRNDIYVQHLQTMAAQASGPVRDQILLLIATQNSITDRTITYNLNITAAMAKLDELDRRFAKSGGYQGNIGGIGVGGGYGRRAAGGPVSPGLFLVGEEGPEMVRFGKSGEVIPNKRIAGAVTGGSGAGTVNYVMNITAGMGADGNRIGEQIISMIKEFERRNGVRWRL